MWLLALKFSWRNVLFFKKSSEKYCSDKTVIILHLIIFEKGLKTFFFVKMFFLFILHKNLWSYRNHSYHACSKYIIFWAKAINFHFHNIIIIINVFFGEQLIGICIICWIFSTRIDNRNKIFHCYSKMVLIYFQNDIDWNFWNIFSYWKWSFHVHIKYL